MELKMTKVNEEQHTEILVYLGLPGLLYYYINGVNKLATIAEITMAGVNIDE